MYLYKEQVNLCWKSSLDSLTSEMIRNRSRETLVSVLFCFSNTPAAGGVTPELPLSLPFSRALRKLRRGLGKRVGSLLITNSSRRRCRALVKKSYFCSLVITN